jgi:hypothetical protein
MERRDDSTATPHPKQKEHHMNTTHRAIADLLAHEKVELNDNANGTLRQRESYEAERNEIAARLGAQLPPRLAGWPPEGVDDVDEAFPDDNVHTGVLRAAFSVVSAVLPIIDTLGDSADEIRDRVGLSDPDGAADMLRLGREVQS